MRHFKWDDVFKDEESTFRLHREPPTQPNSRRPLSRMERNVGSKICWHYARPGLSTADTGVD